MITIEQKINHLKSLGLEGDFTEVKKMYEGKPFDTSDPLYKKVVELSEKYCDELSSLMTNNGLSDDQISKRRNEILDILFPRHGPIFGECYKLKTVIGLVDVCGMNYINSRVDFGKTSLVHLGSYVFVANDVSFGENEISGCNVKLGKIFIKDDTWVCAGVKIGDNTVVGGKSVVSLGSVVYDGSNTIDETIVSGNPAKSVHKILENHTKINKGFRIDRTEHEIKAILEHVKKQKIAGDFNQYVRLLENKEHNALDPTISQIFGLTHRLCAEYNDKNTTFSRKKEILDILFFMHGDGIVVGNNFICDIMGTVRLGSKVKIGNGVSLAGNIEICNNTTIHDNVLIQGIGHRVVFDQRHLGNDENGNICEINVPTFIKIASGVKIAKGTKIAGNTFVSNSTNENEIIK